LFGMNFEDELREALRREPAPPDFAAKVLARAQAAKRGAIPNGRVPAKVVSVPLRRRPAVAIAIAAGLALAALIPPWVSEYHRRQEIRGLEARRELLLALTITRAKLIEARARIQRAQRHTL
jgi:hypothetical protein